jgi:hypothetical protein
MGYSVYICACCLLIRITNFQITDKISKENETTNNNKPMVYDSSLGIVISDKLIEKTAWEYGENQIGGFLISTKATKHLRQVLDG